MMRNQAYFPKPLFITISIYTDVETPLLVIRNSFLYMCTLFLFNEGLNVERWWKEISQYLSLSLCNIIIFG